MEQSKELKIKEIADEITKGMVEFADELIAARKRIQSLESAMQEYINECELEGKWKIKFKQLLNVE